MGCCCALHAADSTSEQNLMAARSAGPEGLAKRNGSSSIDVEIAIPCSQTNTSAEQKNHALDLNESYLQVFRIGFRFRSPVVPRSTNRLGKS